MMTLITLRLLAASATMVFMWIPSSCSLTSPQKSSAKNRRQVLEDVIGKVLVISCVSTNPCHALTPEEASKAYDTYATTYDELDGGKASDVLGIDEARATLFGQARGDVLEIGCGTGLNLAKYDLAKVTSLTLLDVSDGMLQEARKRAASMDIPKGVSVRFIQADATSELVEKFGKASFDTVVDSFSFCVMGTQGAKDCLKQMSQVAKPKVQGGQVLLLENTRSSNPFLGLYQDATADAAASVGGKGCVYNQDVSKMIQGTKGLEIVREDLYAAGIFRGYQCQVTDAT
jgi:methyltransferase OMS1, mitochondrial